MRKRVVRPFLSDIVQLVRRPVYGCRSPSPLSRIVYTPIIPHLAKISRQRTHKMNPGCLSRASRLALDEHARTSPRRVSRHPVKLDFVEMNIAEAAQQRRGPRQGDGASGARIAFETWAKSSTPTSLDVYASLTPVSDGRPSIWSGVWQSDLSNSSSSSGGARRGQLPRSSGLTVRPTISLQRHKERVQATATDFARIRYQQERAAQIAAKNLPVRESTALASPLVSPRMYTLPPSSPRQRRGSSPGVVDAPCSASGGAASGSAVASPANSRPVTPMMLEAPLALRGPERTPARAQSARLRSVTKEDGIHRFRPPSPHSRFMGQRMVGGSFM